MQKLTRWIDENVSTESARDFVEHTVRAYKATESESEFASTMAILLDQLLIPESVWTEDQKFDDEARLRIMGMWPQPDGYDHVSFDRISPEVARTLLSEGFANPDDRQNDAPTFLEFVKWMEKAGDKAYAHGYVIGPERSDRRVTIEGVALDGPLTPQEALDFYANFRTADECNADKDGAFCWWD